MNTPAHAAPGSPVEKLGISAGHVVQEFGWDEDVDDEFRMVVEEVTGSEPEDEEYTGVADAILLWWREDDGDLVDALVDALTTLADGGTIILLTPKAGRDGEVDASEVEESALTAGLHASGSMSAGRDWGATRLVAARTVRR